MHPNAQLHIFMTGRENFSLAFFALSEPIWAGDVGTAAY
jgi:hypothetical protein